MAGDILYIKADKNVEVTRPDITLGDILSLECSNASVAARVKTLRVLRVQPKKEKEKNRYVVSILKIIEIIHGEYPNLEIQNMGEPDIIVTYESQKTPNSFVHWAKTIAVVIITFFGAAFSIMAFNNDVDTTKLFAQIYEQVTGTASDGFTVLEVTYCVGVIIGILVFFNHFGKKRFSVDPTPMEVEMRTYENDIQTTLVETYARKQRELDVGSRKGGK